MDNKIPKIDYLTSLPTELLLEIFKDYEIREGPISKYLLPFTRAPVFKNITIKSVESFYSLLETILHTPSVGGLVKTLTIKIVENLLSRALSISIKKESVVAVFKAFTSLWYLCIDWEWLATLLALEAVQLAKNTEEVQLLPQLRGLHLVDPFKSLKHPWSFKHFQPLLSILPELDLLTLKSNSNAELSLVESTSNLIQDGQQEEIIRTSSSSVSTNDDFESSLAEEEEDLEENELELLSLVKLDICSSIEDPYMIDTILSFILTSLRISDRFAGPGLLDLLEYVYPETLYGLHIYEDMSFTSHYSDPVCDIFSVITRFDQLEMLTLSARVFTSQLFQFIRDPLPLRILTLGYDCLDVDIEDLKRLLILGPGKLSSLEKLQLDVVWGSVGNKTKDEGLYLNETIRQYTPRDDWNEPIFTESFSKEGLEELIILGEKYNVTIAGHSVNAIDIKNQWDQEWNVIIDELEERM